MAEAPAERDCPALEIACRIPGIAKSTYHGDPAKRQNVDRAGLVSLGDRAFRSRWIPLPVRSQPGHDHFGGVNIYPPEIGAELSRMPGVADCAVFGGFRQTLQTQIARALPGAFGTSNMTSDALHHAAVDTNGGAVDHGGALAAEEHDHVRDFFRLREALIDRAGAMVLDEVLRGLID
jgi:hypothetical protein